MDQKPGSILLIDPRVVDGVSFSTHMLPVKMIVDYFLESLKCEIIIIGIQPKSLEFGETVSEEVKKSTKQIADEPPANPAGRIKIFITSVSLIIF